MTTTLAFPDYGVTEWGPPTWTFLHVYAGTYPLHDADVTPDVRQKFTQLITLVMELLPCIHPCRPEATGYLKRNPLSAQVMRNRQTLSQYLLDFHNFVNVRTGKPAWTMQRAILHHKLPLPLPASTPAAGAATTSSAEHKQVKQPSWPMSAATQALAHAAAAAAAAASPVQQHPTAPALGPARTRYSSIATPASAARQAAVPTAPARWAAAAASAAPGARASTGVTADPYAILQQQTASTTAVGHAPAATVARPSALATQPAAGIVTQGQQQRQLRLEQQASARAARAATSRNPLASRLLQGRRV